MFVQTLSKKFGQDFEVEVQAKFEVGVWSVFFCRCFVEYWSKMNLGRDSEARFGQDFEAQVLWRGWCLVEILKLMLGQDSEDEIWSRFVFELVTWTQPSGPLCLWQCFNSLSLVRQSNLNWIHLYCRSHYWKCVWWHLIVGENDHLDWMWWTMVWSKQVLRLIKKVGWGTWLDLVSQNNLSDNACVFGLERLIVWQN